MARRHIARGGSLPHAHYDVDLAKLPDTYIEPFVAYRAWNWKAEGITSLEGSLWTPKQAFEATCRYKKRSQGMVAAATNDSTRKFWEKHAHHVPDPTCTCGMYAGINMQHMIDVNYIQRGIHGAVYLWGRLLRHELGWRAQYAYPKFFIVPANMVPVKAEEALRRLAALVEFNVDIYLQREREARVGQQTIPLWVKNYGYSVQGTEFLIERWRTWNSTNIANAPLAVGDRVAVLGDNGGIGIVHEIRDDEMYYTMFKPNLIYHKKVSDVKWNEQNWRWETSGLGSMRKLEHRNYREVVS